MNLWKRLEERGHEEYTLDSTWHLYAVDLSDGDDFAEVKFAQKNGNKYRTKNDIVGFVGFRDLL
jgi:hypothetical protein